jgi:hypothetical protein
MYINPQETRIASIFLSTSRATTTSHIGSSTFFSPYSADASGAYSRIDHDKFCSVDSLDSVEKTAKWRTATTKVGSSSK